MLNKLAFKQVYRNLFDDFNKDFLVPCYRECSIAFRASGFFSLESLLLSSDGLFEFIKKQGTLKIICSPMLSNDDIENIKNGKVLSENDITNILLNEIDSSIINDDLKKIKLDFICNLIASDIIQLKIGFMPEGIYHEKFGIFIDENNNSVYFNGSFNSTENGSLSNTESFFVATSWTGSDETIAKEIDYFKSLWDNKFDKIKILTFPEVVKNKLFSLYKKSSNLEESVFKLVQKLSGKKVKELWPFQEKAIDEFVNNEFTHFYEMATGTGKTFTSIRTIKKVGALFGKCFVVILVPQIDLQNQWIYSLKDDGFKHTYCIGGVTSHSEQEFSEALINFNLYDETVVCVALYDTFFGKFYSEVNSIDDLFIIVDEAHNLTKNYFDKLPKNPKFKLGLSATIERWSKKETNNILEYFTNGKPTFYYGIKDAIAAKFLSPYEYHPIFTHIDISEFEKFKAKTKTLAQKLNEKNQDDEEIQKIRTERSLIIKKASCKLDLLQTMVNGNYDFKNSVVYCGQGKDGEESIIDNATKILSNGDKYVVSQYTSKTENRLQVLYEFENNYFDTLLAIKCFDEGVDVPKLDKIYIMASDASVRQTVQRRGRVLRQCKETNKEIAYIFDMVVLPPYGVVDGTGVLSLLRNEFLRVNEYASLCKNKTIYGEIKDILSQYGFCLEDLINGENELDN